MGLALFCLPVRAAPEAPPLTEYRVRPGDTLAGIARELYGDARRVDLILRHNDLGPPPHRLQAGQVLRVVPDAWLAAARGRVELYAPGRRLAMGQTPLDRGHRVATAPRASADLEFSDGTRARLGEQSLLLVAGADAGQVPGVPALTDTALLRGTLRLSRPASAGGPIAIATPAARIQFAGGEGVLRVDAAQATIVAVQEGEWQVAAGGRVVRLGPGRRVHVELGRPPEPPVPLPGRPQWTQAPGPLLLTLGDAVEARGAFQAGPGPAPAQWRVQVARDERFADLVQDALVPAGRPSGAGAGAEGRLLARGLGPGTYVARVAALDEELVEGPFGPLARFSVAEVRVLPGGDGAPARVTVPPGLFCSLDGSETAAVFTALPLQPGRGHTLRCAATPGGPASEVQIDAAHCGPLLHRLEPGPVRWDGSLARRRLRIHLFDAAGLPVSGLRLLVRPEGETLASTIQEEEPGTYTLLVAWPREATPGTLYLSLAGTGEIAVPVPGAPALRPASPGHPAPARPAPPRPGRPAPASLPPPGTGPRVELRPRTGVPAPLSRPTFTSALGGGLLLSDPAQGPFGAALLLQAGARFPLRRGALAAGLRVGIEDFSYVPGVRGPCRQDGGDPPMLCVRSRGGDYAYLFARALVTLSVPLVLELRSPERAVVPYLGLAPQLVLAWSQSQVVGLANRVTRSEHAAVHVYAGLRLRPFGVRWPAVFVEAGYRHADQTERRRGDASLSGAMLLLGAQLER